MCEYDGYCNCPSCGDNVASDRFWSNLIDMREFDKLSDIESAYAVAGTLEVSSTRNREQQITSFLAGN